jgi:hypothetical protein
VIGNGYTERSERPDRSELFGIRERATDMLRREALGGDRSRQTIIDMLKEKYSYSRNNPILSPLVRQPCHNKRIY